jgi:GNAT superfamily N-acetyltransferase
MCTRPGIRRCGHGSKILSSLIEWLTTRGVARLELHASPGGLEMYRRAGFTEEPYLAMYRMGNEYVNAEYKAGRGGLWTR